MRITTNHKYRLGHWESRDEFLKWVLDQGHGYSGVKWLSGSGRSKNWIGYDLANTPHSQRVEVNTHCWEIEDRELAMLAKLVWS